VNVRVEELDGVDEVTISSGDHPLDHLPPLAPEARKERV
jgi:hypothetical protein